MTSNHSSNKKCTRCGKIIGTPFHPLINSKQLRKIQNKRPFFYHFNRRKEVVITRAKIGHSFATHSFLIGENPSPICDKYQTDLSVRHIIFKIARSTRIYGSISLYRQTRKKPSTKTTSHKSWNS